VAPDDRRRARVIAVAMRSRTSLPPILALVVACGGGDAQPQSEPPESLPVGSSSPAREPPPAPRGPDEVDELGVGKLVVGTPADRLATLGFEGEPATGSGSFTQNGKPIGTVRFGSRQKLHKDGVEQIVVEIEPARMSVDEIFVRGQRPKTREGLAVGATLEQ